MADKTVLLAEDDASIRLIVNQTLVSAGYEVRATSSPDALQRWVRNGEGDVVVTDVYLGDTSIFDLLPSMKYGIFAPPTLIELGRAGLSGVSAQGAELSIGATTTLRELALLRKHRELCDVVLFVGSRKIFAHRWGPRPSQAAISGRVVTGYVPAAAPALAPSPSALSRLLPLLRLRLRLLGGNAASVMGVRSVTGHWRLRLGAGQTV